jgi:hypothetical protein
MKIPFHLVVTVEVEYEEISIDLCLSADPAAERDA